jgi:solute carrier family 25 folate transporter 32
MSTSSPRPTLFGPSLDHAIAGLTAGSITTLFMHPLDLVKIRFQLADSPSIAAKGKAPAGRGGIVGFGKDVVGAMGDAMKKDGYKGLYRGLGSNVAGNASSWGLYFLW